MISAQKKKFFSEIKQKTDYQNFYTQKNSRKVFGNADICIFVLIIKFALQYIDLFA